MRSLMTRQGGQGYRGRSERAWAFIDTEPDMEVVGEASYGVGAVDQARKLDPDMILLDMVRAGPAPENFSHPGEEAPVSP